MRGATYVREEDETSHLSALQLMHHISKYAN
jgi:hypothetical protein